MTLRKTQVNKDDEGAIVIPVKKLRTRSGREASDVLAERGIVEEVAITKAVNSESESVDEIGRDLRIKDGRVLIKFPKFVHMIVMHDFEDVMEKHANEDIVISSELLVDLANAHDEIEDAMPWGHLIAAGIIGCLVTIIFTQLFL